LITAAELIAASQPLRPKTAEESRRALQALGLDEDQQKECTQCHEWKLLDEFYTMGWKNGVAKYDAACKVCKLAAQAIRRAK
jgi:hypothetical protein